MIHTKFYAQAHILSYSLYAWTFLVTNIYYATIFLVFILQIDTFDVYVILCMYSSCNIVRSEFLSVDLRTLLL